MIFPPSNAGAPLIGLKGVTVHVHKAEYIY